MNENHIILKSIDELLKEKFYVPSYQRGYRWNESQVIDLLDDIWDFKKTSDSGSKEDFYCLQPLVVIRKESEWILIDGQQRLTTIYLILAYLNDVMSIIGKEKYSIRYETRSDSEDFLKNIDLNKADENIDYYHICEAYKTIQKWFSERDGNTKINFLTTLLNDNDTGKNVKVIWYEVNDGTGQIDIFTRINMGKIPLTNAELIKALFLRNDNPGGLDDRTRLQQLEIANEWDIIENSLQNDEFWYFLNQNDNNLETRIELIFDLIAEKDSQIDEYFTFRFFNSKFSNDKKSRDTEVKNNWKEIKDCYLTFHQWFNNRELYHYIGYLISNGIKIEIIKEASKNKTKKEFKQYLKMRIKELVNYDVDKLDYEENSKIIDRILLIYNIETILKNTRENSRFPFDKYKKDKWSLEHIHAQNSEGLDSSEKRKSWLLEIKKTIIELGNIKNENDETINLKLIIESIDSLQGQEKIEKVDFETIQNDIFNLFGKSDLHTIDNLALISGKDNSSLNNSVFPVKRNKIIALEKEGSFIPICTRNVFLKYYTQNATQPYFWGENDRTSYLSDIKDVLSEFVQTVSDGE